MLPPAPNLQGTFMQHLHVSDFFISNFDTRLIGGDWNATLEKA